METLLSRYRNLTVLLIVVVAQLLYLGYQVKTTRDERLIRVWAVSAVTPMAGVVEAIRRNTIGFLQDYFILLDVREQNRKLKADNDHLRMENVYFRNQLSTAEHARALILFQKQTPSKTIPARVIGNSTVATAKAVFIDRGSTSGIEKGMAVVTPEGIVGKVIAVYPLVSQVLLVTDATFKVGVESQRGHVHGVLDCGTGKCSVDQIQNEERVDPGEWFFTSGEDRIFPKGFPVGTVVSAQPGQGVKDIHLSLSGAPGGVEEVLVVLQGIHQPIPTEPAPIETTMRSLPPPPSPAGGEAGAPRSQTEADKTLAKYQAVGKEQAHVYGGIGSNLPNFNPKAAPGAGTPANTGTAPAKLPASGSTVASSSPNASPPPGVRPPGNSQPSTPAVLGSRPGIRLAPPQPTITAPGHDALSGPPLPLGAPRRKATSAGGETDPPHSARPDRTSPPSQP
jgi:rod shape-determining protein MreC